MLKTLQNILIVLAALVVGTLAAEGIVRAFNFDWRFIAKGIGIHWENVDEAQGKIVAAETLLQY